MKRHEANRILRLLLKLNTSDLSERVWMSRAYISCYETKGIMSKSSERELEKELDKELSKAEDPIVITIGHILQQQRGKS